MSLQVHDAFVLARGERPDQRFTWEHKSLTHTLDILLRLMRKGHMYHKNFLFIC